MIDIGIPPGAPVEIRAGLIDDARAGRGAARGAANTTKFSSGHVVVAGGSRGLTGAPVLAASAAMRAGAGYVTCCAPRLAAADPGHAPARGHDARAARRTTARTSSRAPTTCSSMTERGGSLVLGPGLGRTDGAREFARALVRRSAVPLLLDADGLGAFAERLGDLREASGRRGDHAARGRARPAARPAQRRDQGAPAARRRARPPTRPARSSCSRATTRSSRSPTGSRRSARARRPRSRPRAPATC